METINHDDKDLLKSVLVFDTECFPLKNSLQQVKGIIAGLSADWRARG